MNDPIRVFPKRDPRTGEVYHVRFELVFDGIKRYEVCLQKPRKVVKLRFKDHFGGGLRKFSEQFYGERGEPTSSDNGIDFYLYRKKMIAQSWAIIKEGEKKTSSGNG